MDWRRMGAYGRPSWNGMIPRRLVLAVHMHLLPWTAAVLCAMLYAWLSSETLVRVVAFGWTLCRAGVF